MLILLTNAGGFISKILKFFIEVFPFLATLFVVSTLAEANQVLWFIALMLYILPKIGFDVNVVKRFKRFKRTRKLLSRWLKTASIVGRLEDEYIEETGDAIINTFKEARKMKDWFGLMKLWLKHNKSQLLGLVALILFGLDYFIGFTEKLGTSQEMLYVIAAIVVAIIFWVLGIEGWTSNITNKIREDAKIAEREAKNEIKDYVVELEIIDKKMKWIEKLGTPQEYQQEYNVLKVKFDKINSVINEIRSRL